MTERAKLKKVMRSKKACCQITKVKLLNTTFLSQRECNDK